MIQIDSTSRHARLIFSLWILACQRRRRDRERLRIKGPHTVRAYFAAQSEESMRYTSKPRHASWVFPSRCAYHGETTNDRRGLSLYCALLFQNLEVWACLRFTGSSARYSSQTVFES
jgi:hypothetical protein